MVIISILSVKVIKPLGFLRPCWDIIAVTDALQVERTFLHVNRQRFEFGLCGENSDAKTSKLKAARPCSRFSAEPPSRFFFWLLLF